MKNDVVKSKERMERNFIVQFPVEFDERMKNSGEKKYEIDEDRNVFVPAAVITQLLICRAGRRYLVLLFSAFGSLHMRKGKQDVMCS